jgi:hypothetical protein
VKKPWWAFWKSESSEPVVKDEYPAAYHETYDPRDDGEPLWKKYLGSKDRDTMRLPVFGMDWLSWLPFVGQKVDTIDYCRKELARLNVEIEQDQKDPKKYPLMNSAFIQFNHQVAAHMACQAVSHHLPNEMTPRLVEISPKDVIWDNMSVKWWERYLRTSVVFMIVTLMIIGWAIPVAFTGLLSQIRYLQVTYTWLAWLQGVPDWLIAPIQGVLPALFLSILLILLPIILRLLAKAQGLSTGVSVELVVQNYYFLFLFVQLFLIVTLSAGLSTTISQLQGGVQNVPTVLAENLPKSSNYFFSYLLLQALSTSAGVLLQLVGLIGWFILGPLFDSTARDKWKRQVNLPNIQWGTFFPVYTNLAVIGRFTSLLSLPVSLTCYQASYIP